MSIVAKCCQLSSTNVYARCGKLATFIGWTKMTSLDSLLQWTSTPVYSTMRVKQSVPRVHLRQPILVCFWRRLACNWNVTMGWHFGAAVEEQLVSDSISHALRSCWQSGASIFYENWGAGLYGWTPRPQDRSRVPVEGAPGRLTILNDLTVHNYNIQQFLTDLPISCHFVYFGSYITEDRIMYGPLTKI